MEEIWKTAVVNVDYEVSNMGNVRSNRNKKKRLLKPFKKCGSKQTSSKGCHLFVSLSKDGVSVCYPVHRLVAMTFIPNPLNLPQVNHKNGIKNDNRVENLEWCDNSYNIWHAYNILGNTVYKDRKICQYTKQGAFIREWESANQVEKKLGFLASTITSVCKRKQHRKTAYGFNWRFANDKDCEIDYEVTAPVVQISKYGEKIKTFNTIKEAALEVGISIGGITGVCKRRNKGYNYAGGYLWRYKNEYDDNEFGYFKSKTFVKMTKSNLFVAEYKGVYELVDKSGCDLVKVIMCCKGDRVSTNDYKWCIKEEGMKVRNTNREKAVVQLDKNMNYIADYQSTTKAAKATNTH